MIDRKILTNCFTKDSFPNLKCPFCNNGILKRLEPQVATLTKSAKLMHKESWCDPEMLTVRFPAILECSYDKCGEYISLYATGKVFEQQYEDENGYQREYIESFKIESLYPSPHIINLPEELDGNIRLDMISSFNAVWFDPSLATNGIRRALEKLITHLGVPPTAEGEFQSLGNKIKILEGIDSEHANFFSVMKPVVNFGSHQETIELETVLDAYEALEIFLEQLFDKKEEQLEELKAKLAKAYS